MFLFIINNRYMDRKNQKIYSRDNSNKKDNNIRNLRNEIPFQNMMLNPNNIFQFGPIPNIVFVDTNFLNKKRESQDLSPNDILPSEDKSKCKYLYQFNIIYFF